MHGEGHGGGVRGGDWQQWPPRCHTGGGGLGCSLGTSSEMVGALGHFLILLSTFIDVLVTGFMKV